MAVVEDAAAEAAGSPAFELAARLVDGAGEMPAGGDVSERAIGRVRVSAPASDAVVFLADGAVVPVAGAEGGVAAFGDIEEIRWSAAPAVDSAGDVEGAGVVSAGVEGDVAVGWGEGGGLGEGQGGDRKGDQEGFTPPPPDRVSATAARQARRTALWRLAACLTPVTLHQRPTSVIPVLAVGMTGLKARRHGGSANTPEPLQITALPAPPRLRRRKRCRGRRRRIRPAKLNARAAAGATAHTG